MKKSDLLRVWGGLLRGRRPFLSLEITKECPLRCPGCYAFSPDHVSPGLNLIQLSDYKGDDLVRRALDVVRRLRPVHLSIIGGEPLVRYRELNTLLPELDRMNVEVQLVTSAVRPIPIEWSKLPSLHISVSIDGQEAEHNARRTPATYDRILKHIQGHQIIVHCTVTRPMVLRPDYLRDFTRFWSDRSEVRRVWFSIYTPQQGDDSAERLRPEDRHTLLEELPRIAKDYAKVHLPRQILDGYRNPPQSPAECTFARVTTCLSADLDTRVEPCQLGGNPVCSECGCVASAGMHGLAQYKLGGLVPLSALLDQSLRFGGLEAEVPDQLVAAGARKERST